MKFKFIGIFLIIVIFSFPTICFSEIQTVKKTDDKWILYGTLDLGDYYYDKSSIKKVGPKIIKVWTKRKYSKVGKDKLIQLIKNNNLSIDGWEKLDYETGLVEFDCVNKTYIFIKNVQYNDKGEILKNVGFQNPTIYQTIPDSLFDILQRTVCPKK
jgi:hypothetical protein